MTTLWLLLLISTGLVDAQIGSLQTQATRGKFFIYTLHSATFFQHSVPVEWTATMRHRPLLPAWMKLVQSKYPGIAYLVGTPIGRLRSYTIHIIAKELKNFSIQEKYLTVYLDENGYYAGATREVVSLHVRNLDVEDLISDRSGLIGKMEFAAKETFKGRRVNPYIYSIAPAIDVDSKRLQALFGRNSQRKIGTIVSIGTQNKFLNFKNYIESFSDKNKCAKKNVRFDASFSPAFDVDWCKSEHRMVTLVRDFADEETEKDFKTQPELKLDLAAEKDKLVKKNEGIVESGYSFWDAILVFPAIAVALILLILVLSIIFFGCREGQQWRDYKTPKEQLEEYASVKEGQRKLRDLSQQRQILLRADDKANSMAPSDIHTFLQPKSLPRYQPGSVLGSRNPINKSRSQLRENGEPVAVAPPIDSIPLGKHTVAEAARACGSSLHLYRNPLDTDSDPDEDRDSLEEPVIESA